jgi:hypothetical protein
LWTASGGGDALPLAAGQVTAAPPEEGAAGVQAVRQGVEDGVGAGGLRGRGDGGGFAGALVQDDVLPGGDGPAGEVLGKHCQAAPELSGVGARQVGAVPGDGAGGGGVEAGEECGEGGFAGAVVADDGQHLTAADRTVTSWIAGSSPLGWWKLPRGRSPALGLEKAAGQGVSGRRVGLYAGFCSPGPRGRRGGGHPSRTAVAGSLQRSTRGLGRAALTRPRRAVLPRRRAAPLDLAPGEVYRAAQVTLGAGGLLHHRFTLTGSLTAPAVCFLWHCLAGHPGWPLATTLPCGARTFLGGALKGTDATARTTRLPR